MAVARALEPLVLRPNNSENLQTVAVKIRELITQHMPGTQVSFFGSAVSGLSLQGSDVDSLIHLTSEEIQIETVCSILRLRDSGFYISKVLSQARVPLVKCVHRSSAIRVDLTFDTPFKRRTQVIQNTLLMSKYAGRPKFRKAYLSFKLLFRDTPVTSNQFGGLSSYAWGIIFSAVCLNERCFGLVNINTYRNERYRRRAFPKPFTSVLMWVLEGLGSGTFFKCAFDIRGGTAAVLPSPELSVPDPYEERDLAEKLQPEVSTLAQHLARHWIYFLERNDSVAIEREHVRICEEVIPRWKTLKPKGRKRPPYSAADIGLHP